MNLRRILEGILLVAGLTIATPSLAQTGPEPSANVSIVSDYRYRGVSLSDRDPAVQGGMDLETDSLFIGVWGSSIAEYGGANAEVDLYAGLHGESEGIGWRVGAYGYLYPGGTDVNYLELAGEASTSVGPATFGIEGAFAPRQDNLEEANTYVGASAAFGTAAGLSLVARAGFEDGSYNSKIDWELGATYSLGALAASVSYVDTNYSEASEAGALGAGALVFSLSAAL